MRVLLVLLLLQGVAMGLPDYSGVWVSTGGRQPDNNLVLLHQGKRLTMVRNFANNTNLDQFTLGGGFQEAYLGQDQGLNRQFHQRAEARCYADNALLYQEFRLSVQNPDMSHGFRNLVESFSVRAGKLAQSDGSRLLQYVRLGDAESEIRVPEGTFSRTARARWEPGRARLRIGLYDLGRREEEITLQFERNSPPYRRNLKEVELKTHWGNKKLKPDQADLVVVPLFDATSQLVGVRFRTRESVSMGGEFTCSVWAPVGAED